VCACGNPSREGIDHTTHVCSTAGFFPKADLDAINATAKESPDAQARHAR
jgi:hypothetical protein